MAVTAKFNTARDKLEDEDLVTERPAGDAKWYRLPHVKPGKLDKARATKPPLFAEWTQALQRAGHHAEELWRQAFRAAGWTVPNGPVRIDCPLPDDEEGAHSEEHEIDVFATRPGLPWQVACEVKNGYGEGWVDPSIVAEWKLTDPQRRIRHHFRAMHHQGMRPMLAAPYVDPSFYAFQRPYLGVHAKGLYHHLHPDDAPLAQRIRDHFRLGHTRADSDPPSNYRQFAERLPRILRDQSNRAAS